MSHTRVKTTYNQLGPYGSNEEHVLYCHHNHSCDITTFYDKNGEVADMCFDDSSDGKWEAMIKLWSPFENKWNGPLLDGVEHYFQEIDREF